MASKWSKIPLDLHTTIFSWHCSGLSNVAIVEKLHAEHKLTCERKSVGLLIRNLREEKEKLVGTVLADRASASVTSDYSQLEEIQNELKVLGAVATKENDVYLRLKIVDRQTKILLAKLALSSDSKGRTGSVTSEALLDSLLNNTGGRK